MRVAIGDVHGKYPDYLKITKNIDNSIQIGDFGFDYSVFKLCNISLNHRFFKGNHDNYDYYDCPNELGRFGVYQDFFYISGAYSIDKHMRVQGRDWFPNEELDYKESSDCIFLYNQVKPTIVLSHDCPDFLFGYKNYTNRLLTNLFEAHQPNLWIFGHHHMSMRRKILGTDFKCLNELEVFEF